MIKAQLPDGTTLSFPDDTPDEVIDTAVRKHIQDKNSGPSENEQQILSKLDQLQASIEDSMMEEEPEIEEPEPEKEDILSPALNGMIDKLEGIAQILQTKKDKVRDTDHTLVMSIETLNVSVGALVSEIASMKQQSETQLEDLARILKSPRKLIKDSDGNPVGSRLEEDNG